MLLLLSPTLASAMGCYQERCIPLGFNHPILHTFGLSRACPCLHPPSAQIPRVMRAAA